MDANLQRPFLLADERDWERAGEPPRLVYDRPRRLLHLASTRREPALAEDVELATRLRERTQGSIDRFGTRARWDEVAARVLATGAFEDEVAIDAGLPPHGPVQDLAIGFDDVLYLAAGSVLLQDLRARFEPRALSIAPDFSVSRLAAIPQGGVYCLDRTARRLARITGLPSAPRGANPPSPLIFRAKLEDLTPARALVLTDATWPSEESAVAIACSAEGTLALLTWRPAAEAQLRILGDDGRFGPPTGLEGVRFPYALRWVGSDRVALLIARSEGGAGEEAPVYPVFPKAASVRPVGDLYPLQKLPARATRTLGDWPAFLHNTQPTPEYTTPRGPLPLLAISFPSFEEQGDARNEPRARLLDAGDAQCTWHRLYLEASIPAHCAVKVWLAVNDQPSPPELPEAWHEHHFGPLSEAPAAGVPQGVWLPQASELPFHEGLLPCARAPQRSGLWTALIQRAQHRVRSLSGRYAWVRLELHGDGRSTPEVAALRVYADRRSYVKSYLPELYHEQLYGAEADQRGVDVRATPADFLERFVANFEGILTPLEDRIKDAWLLSDPGRTPEPALAWLSSWIGLELSPGLPVARRRAWLARALELYRKRGTLAGLQLALDLATGGAVTRREIVVFEDYRLRRTFATILGANLADADDPLLPGLSISGNSYVGDTLVLGEEHDAEFLAVFAADLATTRREARAVAALFERLAHRATVLVHERLAPEELARVRQIIELESPAHVQVQLLAASERLVVGLSSLVGLDTFLGAKPDPQPVRLGWSDLGRGDHIEHLPSLDPRLGGTRTGEP